MTTPFIGEIRMFGFPRTPTGWEPCDGRLLAISEYDVLFTLLGTTYGGDGISSFGVPDLSGRLPVHQGQGPGLSNYIIGDRAGVATVDLTSNQLPGHSHQASATTASAVNGVASPSLVPGTVSGDTMYVNDIAGLSPITTAAATVSGAVADSGHDNSMPTLVVQFCIATQGLYPSQN